MGGFLFVREFIETNSEQLLRMYPVTAQFTTSPSSSPMMSVVVSPDSFISSSIAVNLNQ